MGVCVPEGTRDPPPGAAGVPPFFNVAEPVGSSRTFEGASIREHPIAWGTSDEKICMTRTVCRTFFLC
jgi:hypothetical protein